METSKLFKEYKVVRASALAQAEVLSLLSPSIIQRWSMINEPVVDVVEEFLLLYTIGLPFEIKKKLHTLLLSGMTKDDVYADIKDFSGEMMKYHEILAEVIEWNLSDFFTYMDSVHRKGLKQAEKGQSPQ